MNKTKKMYSYLFLLLKHSKFGLQIAKTVSYTDENRLQTINI